MMVGQQVDSMANPEHVAKLAEGVEAWNRWRREKPGLVPNLISEDLRERDLAGANLNDALLTGADLSGSDLSSADLRAASLAGARLANVGLSDADLTAANLRKADLRGALIYTANLNGAEVEGADFTNALVGGGTIFGGNDLSKVKGLETVAHLGPSAISIDTIYRSQGRIPDAFLREAGIPEDVITFMKSTVGTRTSEFSSCFISYSNRDDAFARKLRAKLQAEKVRCWFAPEDLKIGDRFQERIEESIRLYDKLLVVLSENSVNSPWVERE